MMQVLEQQKEQLKMAKDIGKGTYKGADKDIAIGRAKGTLKDTSNIYALE